MCFNILHFFGLLRADALPMASPRNPIDNLSHRDYRSVETNDATKFRMPSGMRPVCGCIPAACKACKTAIFLPSEPFLTECCYCHFSVCFNFLLMVSLAFSFTRPHDAKSSKAKKNKIICFAFIVILFLLFISISVILIIDFIFSFSSSIVMCLLFLFAFRSPLRCRPACVQRINIRKNSTFLPVRSALAGPKCTVHFCFA